MIADIFPPMAFCFGFIVTRFLSSRPQSNDGGAPGLRLENKVDIELGDAQKPPQSTEEVSISFSNKRKTENTTDGNNGSNSKGTKNEEEV